MERFFAIATEAGAAVLRVTDSPDLPMVSYFVEGTNPNIWTTDIAEASIMELDMASAYADYFCTNCQ